jgi:hypothetical protein
MTPLPPGPRTESQQLAAQAPTIPAPKDPRVEPGTEPTLRDVLRSEAPPADWQTFARKTEKALGLVSQHDLSQDGAIADLATRVQRLETIGAGTAATLGGHAADVARTVEPESPKEPSEAARPKSEATQPKTVIGTLAEIKKANGTVRIMLILGALFEGIRWLAPMIEPFIRGLGK